MVAGWRRGLVGTVVSAVALLYAESASAEEHAKRCTPDATACMTAPLAFSRDFGVDPIGFDTGWVPQGSPIQVHLFAQLFAETHVAMGGHLRTTWPAESGPGLTYATPGEPGSGSLSFHYGVNIGAKAKVQISVLGINYSWTGDIPYFPQFDYHVAAQGAFDPWAFDGFTVDGSTTQQTLAQVSVTDFIGINIPGLDGGFELDSYTELQATYRTLRMLVARPDGTVVEGGPILAEAATTFDHADKPLGGFVEVDVHPEGEVRYDIVLHLIPAFYIDTIGPSFSIPIADIPIPFTLTQGDWNFDPVRVRVPLPDITLEGDPVDVLPGELEIALEDGDEDEETPASATFSVANDGEETLVSTLNVEGPFTASIGLSELGIGSVTNVTVTVDTDEPGDHEGTLTIASNDPDEPARVVQLSTHVDERILPDPPEEEAFANSKAMAAGGCLCSSVQGSTQDGFVVALAGLAVVALRRSRRR